MFTRAQAKNYGDLATMAVGDLLGTYGLEVEYVSGRYGPDGLVAKIRIFDPAEREHAAGNDAMCLGLPADIVGKTFNYPTPTGRIRMFEVTGIKLNRPRYPIQIKNIATGGEYKFSVASLQRYL